MSFSSRIPFFSYSSHKSNRTEKQCNEKQCNEKQRKYVQNVYFKGMCVNTNPAMASILQKYLDVCSWKLLSMNPSMITLLKQNREKINWYYFASNSNGLDMIQDHLDQLPSGSWRMLCNNQNPKAMDIIERECFRNPDHICWSTLSRNPAAIELLKKYIHLIDWYYLSLNENAIPLLSDHVERVVWVQMMYNTSPDAVPFMWKHFHRIRVIGLEELFWREISRSPYAIHILEKNRKNINWMYLSANPNAMHLLEEHPNRINWHALCQNTNTKAIQWLSNRPEKINWVYLVNNTNPEAIPLIERHIDQLCKTSWNLLASNPNALPLFS